jgi:hypothetical protein
MVGLWQLRSVSKSSEMYGGYRIYEEIIEY